MKICMITYSFYETDNRVMRYAETLASRGDIVDVVSLRTPGQERTGHLNGVNLFRLQERTRNERGKFSYLVRIMTFFMQAAAWLTLHQARKKYDVIHVHSVPDFLVFAALVPKMTGAKVVLDIHDILPELYASKFGLSQASLLFRMLLLVERISTAFADQVIIANHLWRDRLIARSVPAHRCVALMNYPDPSIFFQQERTRHDGKFTILYPGTLQSFQRLDIAIRAVRLITEDLPNVELHLYGEGDAKASLIELARELGLDDHVFFHAPRPIREIALIMAQADLGVVPKDAQSFGNEAQSTKILEFMSVGVPVVVADTKIERYYFNDSLVEFFRSGDEHDLARAILRIAKDAELRSARVANASRFAAEYSWTRAKRIYLDMIDNLVRRTPAQKILTQAAPQP
jgi:glycosyltransferase involved in cell wall biosynthesis